MRRGPAATADPDLLGVALARRVPLRGGRNADPCHRDHPARQAPDGISRRARASAERGRDY
jgi:hypothetical protein